MGAKLAVAVAVLLVSIPVLAQVQPAAGPTKPSLSKLERWRRNGLLVGRFPKCGHQQVGADRLGYRNNVALPRCQCGGPLHDLGRKRRSFRIQTLHR